MYSLMQGVTDQGAMLVGPGIVRNTGFGVTTIARDAQDAQAVSVQDMLAYGGMETKLNPNVEGVVWGKLILNAAINPLTALFGLDNGQLVKSDKGRAILRRVEFFFFGRDTCN
jgi:2-dehydropantoate 2-reductase